MQALITEKNDQKLAQTLPLCLAAFIVYCCMYAMRKPFTAAAYDGLLVAGIPYKIVLVIAQVLGYACSKFLGIRLISRLQPSHRARWLLGLLGLALLSLLGFACTPAPYQLGWMFLNGLPLGLVWGVVFGYLEGRRSTELLTAALSVNFIVSSGLVKSIGQWLLLQGVGESWMPFLAGALFVLPLLAGVWWLERIPPPTAADRASRWERTPMNAAARRALWRRYRPGFIVLVAVYLILTVIRDVRDNFAVEIWAGLGFSGRPAILTLAELPIALCTLAGVGALMLVRDNRFAFRLNHWLIGGGGVFLLLSTLLFQRGYLPPEIWMMVSGLALFVPYILFNGILFDRLLATFQEPGNVGFLMYVADAIGYLGSVLVLLLRNFGFSAWSWLEFYQVMCTIGALIFILLTLVAWRYFSKKTAAATPSWSVVVPSAE
jgi:hypothetical protein